MISTELQAIELGSLHASLVTLPVLPANYVSFQRLLTDSEISVDGSDIVDRNGIDQATCYKVTTVSLTFGRLAGLGLV